MRYLIIFTYAILPLISWGQNYSRVVSDSIINNFLNNLDIQRNYEQGDKKIKFICKTIGIWTESDIKQITQSNDSLNDDNIEFINKQVLGFNKLSKWNFILPKKMKLIDYNYDNSDWMWIYSAPVFYKNHTKCIIKVSKYWRNIFPEYKLLSFSKTENKWAFESIIYNGITESNQRILPILELQRLNDSISLKFPKCDTLNGEIFNCYDSSGMKKGYWKNYEKIFLGSSSEICQGCDTSEEIWDYLKKEDGYYDKNKKIGVWNYYNWDDDYSRRKTDTLKTIEYKPDGSTIENNIKDNYTIQCNADSTILTGEIYHESYTITINCKNMKCAFLSGNHKEIKIFEQSNLEDELYRLLFGIYDRELFIINGH